MNAIFVQGLGFGDEGKGTIVDSLTRRTDAGLVVRFNGGCQAAHNVVTATGREHCFSQFGSGTLAGARTHLSKYMLVNPLSLLIESKHLEEIGIDHPLSLVTVDPNAPIITPYHRALNRIRELARGDARHGSTGQGIGELASDLAAHRPHLTAYHLWGEQSVSPALDICEAIRQRCCDEVQALGVTDLSLPALVLFDSLQMSPMQWLNKVWQMPTMDLSDTLPKVDTTIFEGAQGVLLDEWYGFHPYTTWSNCTFDNAVEVWARAGGKFSDVQTIGVTRAYHTRHGAGPFPTEYASLRTSLIDEHNQTDAWQGSFRAGHIDLMLLQYAYAVLGGVDALAVTCVDHIEHRGEWSAGILYPKVDVIHQVEHDLLRQEHIGQVLSHAEVTYQHGTAVEDLLHLIETTLKAPIDIVSSGPTAAHKEYVGVYA